MKVELSELKPEDIPMELIQSHPFVQELADQIIYNQDLEKEVKLPYTHKDVILMSPGTWNGFSYSVDSIKNAFLQTDWTDSDNLALYLDHLDRSARDWIGEVFNVRMKGDTLIGDLKIVSDKPTAMALAYGTHLGISPKVEGDADEETNVMNTFAFRNFSVVKHPAIKTAYINSEKSTTTLNKEEPIILPLEVKKLADEEKPIETPVEESKEEVKAEEPVTEEPAKEAPVEEGTPAEPEALSQKPFEMSEEVLATLAEKLAPMIAKIMASAKDKEEEKEELAEKPKEEPEEEKKKPEEKMPSEMADALGKISDSVKALSEKVETLSTKKVEVKNSESKLVEPSRMSKKAPSDSKNVKELSQKQMDTAMYNILAAGQGNPEKIKEGQ